VKTSTRFTVGLCGVAVVAIASLSIVGHIAHLPLLAASMHPASAICFVLIGFSMLAYSSEPSSLVVPGISHKSLSGVANCKPITPTKEVGSCST
jgi:hypothetical protein